MGRLYDEIDDRLAEWIARQRLYFVASAPTDPDGHVNVSPKGFMPTFAILSPRSVAYLDLTGSGIETVAHVQENGRLVVMFCAFEGPPRIVRLHGTAHAHLRGEARFAELMPRFGVEPVPGAEDSVRAIVEVELTRIADSCGYAVPRMRYEGERDQLLRWTDNRTRKQGAEALETYRQANNGESIDGLPGLERERAGRPG